MSNSPHTSTLLLVIAMLVVVVAATVLSIVDATIPSWFETLATVALGAAAGVAIQGTPPS